MPKLKLKLEVVTKVTLLLVAAVMFAMGLRGLDFQKSGLATPRFAGNPLFEVVPPESALGRSIVELSIVRSITWEELGIQRGISSLLIEESYACSGQGRQRKFSEIRNFRLEPPRQIQLVLRAGACAQQPKSSVPGEHQTSSQ